MKKKSSKKKTAKKPIAPAEKKTARPAAVTVKGWGLRYETMAACESGEGLTYQLNTLMGVKTYQDAWGRGQFLRKLAEAGRGNASLEEVEHDLQLADGTLEGMLARDDEAREAFNNARFATIMKVRRAIVEMTESGKLTPTTLKQLETFLRMQIVHKDVDFEKVPTAVMEELFGVSRQTLIEWKKTRGLRVNADGSYNLKVILQQGWREKEDGSRERVPCWFEQMLRDKICTQPGKYSPSPQNDIDWLKAEKTRRQIAEMDKRLISAERSMASFLARAAAIDKYIAANSENLYLKIAGLAEDKVKEKLEDYNAGLRAAACRLPANYYEMLPDSISESFAELMGQISTHKPKGHHGKSDQTQSTEGADIPERES